MHAQRDFHTLRFSLESRLKQGMKKDDSVECLLNDMARVLFSKSASTSHCETGAGKGCMTGERSLYKLGITMKKGGTERTVL